MSKNGTVLLKSEFRDLSAQEALRNSTNILLRVSDTARQALETIGIKTVFDLASLARFMVASKLVEAADLTVMDTVLGGPGAGSRYVLER